MWLTCISVKTRTLGKNIPYFIIQIGFVFVSIHDMTYFFVSFSCWEGNMLTCIIDMNLFFKLSQEKQ